MSNFESLGLLPELITAVEGMGWRLPHDVQDESIPLILGGGDVLIAAETGSGKTGAFCLPLLQSLYEHLRGDADITAKIVLNNPLAGDASSSSSALPPAAAVAAASSWVMSLTDRDPICAVDGATGLLVQTRHPRDWAGVRANFGLLPVSGGARWYFEATVTDEGLCRVGFTAGSGGTRNLGTDAASYGYGGTGKKSHANKFDDYGAPFKLNDTLGIMLEFKANGSADIAYAKNGAPLGTAFSVPSALAAQGLYPAVVLKNAEMRFNFGTDLATAPFKHAPPAGFRALAEAAEGKERTAPAAAAAAPAAAASSASSSSSSSSSAKSASAAAAAAAAASPSPFALIFEPTRELALQVHDELVKFCVHLSAPKIRHDVFVGGDNNNKSASRAQGLHIVVGTPGRLCDLVKLGKLNVSDTRFLVLDEADQLVGDAQTKRMLLDIYDAMPKHSKGVQVVICSATLHSLDIQLLAESITTNATWVDLKGKDSIPESVDHVVLVADPRTDRSWLQHASASGGARVKTDGVHAGLNLRASTESPDLLSEAIKLLKPHLLLQLIDQFLMDSCMIFARTQLDCDNIEAFLIGVGGGAGKAGTQGFEKRESGKENPYSCVVLHGGRSASERSRNLEAFKSGAVRFLICTDVAARGIDIAQLPFVINLCLPDKPETYIHRVGRVGRAGAVGLAISIVAAGDSDLSERVWWHTCSSKDKGRSCSNTKLTDAGGCTVWFDESDMLDQIEARLGNISIPRLDRHNLAQGAKHVVQVAAKGRRVADDGSAVSGQHVSVLRPTVEELAQLEVTAQCTFWNVKQSSKWANMLK